jgi:hypothetical protein
LESITIGDTNRQPNNIHQKVKDNNSRGNFEDILVQSRRKPIHQDSNGEEHFCHNPLKSAEFDIADIRCKIEIESIDFRKEIICCCLGIGGAESCPGGGRPPRDDKAKETTVFGTTGFGSPTTLSILETVNCTSRWIQQREAQSRSQRGQQR